MPCGNGRNVFFLSKNFKHTTGVDIEPKYIEAIKDKEDAYKSSPLDLKLIDLTNERINLSKYNFICNIHYFDLRLLNDTIEHMAKNSFLLVETPFCNGGNFKDLPNEVTLQSLIKSTEVHYYKFTTCVHPDNVNNNGALKLLLKKN